MDFDAALVAELAKTTSVHVVILYGSRARGDATPESDIDVACFADVAETTRDARVWNGMFLDGFVYPTATLETSDPDMLKLCGGRVLLDRRGHAGPLLARLEAIERSGPKALPEHEKQMRRVWARKMLARIGRGDLEASYRYHWLLYQLLEDYFALRGQWYRGPKLALVDLGMRDPATLLAFERALAPGAPLTTLEPLIDQVSG